MDRRDCVDGNLYALDKHLKEVDDKDEAFEYILKEIKPYVDEIEDLASKCYEIAKDTGYDFDEEMLEELKERISKN